MAADECVCWQTASSFHVNNVSDIVDFPLLVKSKTSNRVIRDLPEFIILGVKTLEYVEASVEGCQEGLSIPVTYKPEVTVEFKKSRNHVYCTAQELVLDFPRYVTVNAYFSLHHRGVSVKAGDQLELMRVEKRCENLRGPVTFLICRYEHREIALPMETRGNFTANVDENIYTISEVIHKFPLPQIVKFQTEELVLNDRVQYSLEEDFCGLVTLRKRYTEEYIVGCPIDFTAAHMNDSNSDDSGIGCTCPTLSKKLVFVNVLSDREFWMSEGILCDQHETLLNSARRIYVDKMTDPKMRLHEDLHEENLLVLTLDEALPPRPPISRGPQDPLSLNIPPLRHSIHGPIPSLSTPNLYLPPQPGTNRPTPSRPGSMIRSATYHSGPPAPIPGRNLSHSATNPAPSVYPIEGDILPLPPRDQPLVLHHIVDLSEIRQRRDKVAPRTNSLLARVSKSKIGQKLHGFLSRERHKSPSSSEETDGGFTDPAVRIGHSPIMNNKRLQRNPVYVDESGNDSGSSDDFDRYPGTVDLSDMYDLDNRYRHSVRSHNYFSDLGKSNLNDSLRRNNLCLPEEKVLNKYPASHNSSFSSRSDNTTPNFGVSSEVTQLRVNLPVVYPPSSPTSSAPVLSIPARTLRDRNGRGEDRTGPREISSLSVQEISSCVKDRGLERIAAILEKNQVDGEFFTSLTPADFQHEPFNASPFEVKQLDRIQHGIKPRV